MEDIKSFTGGMNSDITPIQQPANTYVEALNIEIFDDELQGSVAISNSKGNKFQVSIPDVGEIISIKIIAAGSTLITINGITNPTPFDSTNSTTKDLYDYIMAYAPYGYSTVFNIYYNDQYVIVYPIPENTPSLLITTDVNTFLTVQLFMQDNQNLKVIGYGIIRDDIYLFTTPCTATDPQDPTATQGYGYIWRLRYDNITFDATSVTLDLIYANNLSFTTYYNIPPTGVVGRYENNNIQRLYWTDNYNKLRSLNVADPQLGALDLTLVDVQPSATFDIPLMTDIRSAPGTTVIPIGCYQLAYKLSNTGGSSSTFSAPSNEIFVVQGYIATGTPGASEEFQASGANWKHYHGDVISTTTTKKITWTINNLDRDFTRIEAVVLFRERKNDPPTVYSVFEGPIQNNTIDIIVDGDVIYSNNTTILSLDEFLALSSVFTHCKTIGTKDNRLVAGNVKNQMSELDFDARAYRHKALNNFDIIENGAVVNYPTADYTSVDEESDAICPANVETTYPGFYDATSIYKADGTTVGGTGPNISYEFVSVAVACDKTVEPSNPQPLPIVSTNPDYFGATKYNLGVYSVDDNGTDVLQEYPIDFPSNTNINDGMKYPQMNSIYWGYQHNEIYRIGIQFYDSSKNPYFVKWIGDIKFPDYFDPCPAANNIYADGTQTTFTDYRKSFTTVAGTHGSNEAFVCQLGLKLNVTVPDTLTKQVSGYSIVRVKREETDKTIIAEGLVSNTWLNMNKPYSLGTGVMDYYEGGVGIYHLDYVSFLTPNILDASLTPPTTGMKFRASSALIASNTAPFQVTIDYPTSVGSPDNTVMKMFDHTSVAYFERNIDYAALLTYNQDITISGTEQFQNWAEVGGTYVSNGSASYLLVLDTGIDNTVTGTSDKFFAYIFNPIINQYGGNTYTDRSSSQYIICSHFRSIVNNTAIADTSYIFGGDVTNDIMDEERISVNWAEYPANHYSTTFFYPASSPVNRMLRHGAHPNVSLTDDINPNNDRTEYFYNTVYSCQNDIVTFTPKPDPFLTNEIYDNRFYISDIKINGELTDAWSSFAANNYWDVEGVYGPINSMLPLADKMYFWQDRAFGIIEINPRTLITDNGNQANSQVQTGTGLPLQRHDYISVVNGSKHQGSTISSSNALYWYDANQIKLMRYSPGSGNEPLSDIKGLFSFLSKNLKTEIQNIDKPTYFDISKGLNGVVATYDNKKHRAIFTFHTGVSTGVESFDQKSFTVCLNELKNAFTTYYTFTPTIYINDNKYIISADNNTPNIDLAKLYIHDVGNYGEFYDEVYPSYIKFVVNPNPAVNKTFDNLVWDSQATTYDVTNRRYINYNDDTWSSIRVTNDYQNTDTQALVVDSNIKRRERSWQLAIPRNRVLYSTTDSPDIYTDLSPTEKDFGERMRDKYIQIELTYDNSTNRELKTNNLVTIYRPSVR